MPAVMTISYQGPFAHDVSIQSVDVNFLNVQLYPLENIEIRKLGINISMDYDGDGYADDIQAVNGFPDLKNIRIINSSSGMVAAGPIDGSFCTRYVGADQMVGHIRSAIQCVLNDTITLTKYMPLNLKIMADLSQDSDVGPHLKDGSRLSLGLAHFSDYASAIDRGSIVSIDHNIPLLPHEIVPQADLWGPSMNVRVQAAAIPRDTNQNFFGNLFRNFFR